MGMRRWTRNIASNFHSQLYFAPRRHLTFTPILGAKVSTLEEARPLDAFPNIFTEEVWDNYGDIGDAVDIRITGAATHHPAQSGARPEIGNDSVHLSLHNV